MKRSIIKTVLFGSFLGAALFFAPFLLLKGILIIILVSFIFKIFWWSGFSSRRVMQYRMANSDQIRNMSEEEYSEFKSKYDNKCGQYRYKSCCSNKAKRNNSKSDIEDQAKESK